jgi:hypothetical protein
MRRRGELGGGELGAGGELGRGWVSWGGGGGGELTVPDLFYILCPAVWDDGQEKETSWSPAH